MALLVVVDAIVIRFSAWERINGEIFKSDFNGKQWKTIFGGKRTVSSHPVPTRAEKSGKIIDKHEIRLWRQWFHKQRRVVVVAASVRLPACALAWIISAVSDCLYSAPRWKLIFSKFISGRRKLNPDDSEPHSAVKCHILKIVLWPHCQQHHIAIYTDNFARMFVFRNCARIAINCTNAPNDDARALRASEPDETMWDGRQEQSAHTRFHINFQLKFYHSTEMPHAKRRHVWRCAQWMLMPHTTAISVKCINVPDSNVYKLFHSRICGFLCWRWQWFAW